MSQPTSLQLDAAIREFFAYPAALATVSATAQGVSIGRWTVLTTCHAGSTLLGGTVPTTIRVDIDLPDLRQVIYGIRDRIEDRLELAWPAVADAQQWLVGSLGSLAPALSELEVALTTASGSGRVAEVGQALAALDTMLEGAIATFDAAIDALVELQVDQAAFVDDVAALQGPLAAEMRERLQELLDVLDAAPCGQRDALEQFAHLQTELTASISTLAWAVQEFRRLTAASAHHLGTLRGVVAALRAEVGGLGALVERGALTPDVAADQLQLPDAAEVWATVAGHTAEAAGEMPLRSPLRTPSLRARASVHRD